MGCCFSKKRKHRAAAGRCEPEDRSPPSPEEETVKEVLSETPSAKPRPEPKPVANVVAAPEPEKLEVVKKEAKKQASAVDAAAVSDLGSCVSLSLATDEVSEAASESSVATSSVTGPDPSPPGKPARRRRPVSADLGPPARRDRAGAASYGVRSRSARGSPSPPPRQVVTRDRSARRSPSPAAKRPSEQRRAASPVPSAQRKPPVPVTRPSGRVSPRREQAEAPPPPFAFPPSPPMSSQPEDDAVTVASEISVPNAGVCGDLQGGRDVDGKESLENPLVSMECFIFL